MTPRLPPFFALQTLECAVRHQSYSRAAEELGVTHGAVSQQIRKMEDWFGVTLFHRRHNTMVPTPEAAALAGGVEQALDTLRRAVHAFTTAPEHDPLAVSLEPHFATRWLTPRLPRLLAAAAGANVSFRVEARVADFISDGVDMGIRYGRGAAQDVEQHLLFRDAVFPVCAPALAERLCVISASDLLTAPLIRHPFRPWGLWFSRFGLQEPPPNGPELEDSAMLIGAAVGGVGVALARSGMVEQELARGQLVRLLPNAIDDEYAYWIAWRADSRKLPRIHALRDWLVSEVKRQPTLGAAA